MTQRPHTNINSAAFSISDRWDGILSWHGDMTVKWVIYQLYQPSDTLLLSPSIVHIWNSLHKSHGVAFIAERSQDEIHLTSDKHRECGEENTTNVQAWSTVIGGRKCLLDYHEWYIIRVNGTQPYHAFIAHPKYIVYWKLYVSYQLSKKTGILISEIKHLQFVKRHQKIKPGTAWESNPPSIPTLVKIIRLKYISIHHLY